MSLPNVLAVGLGRDPEGFLVQVLVSHKVPLGELLPGERIPGSLEGCPVDVAEAGGPLVAGGRAAAGDEVGKDVSEASEEG